MKSRMKDGGKPTTDLDPEIITEMMVQCLNSRIDVARRRIDSVLLLSGDGDFDYPLKSLRSFGVKCAVASIDKKLSDFLREATDKFILLDRVFDVRK